jgi:hypothetical protein
MRRAASIFAIVGALAALAVDPALLIRTHTDPSRMFAVPNVRSVDVMTAFLNGGEVGFTAVAWVRFHPIVGAIGPAIPNSMWSIEPARATREGGAELPAIMDYQTVTDNSGGTFGNPHYACPDTLQGQWGYGCYCVNIETPVDVTVTIAGAERSVAASNGVKQAFNILGTAADYSWSVTGPTGGATPVKFGFAVNPLAHFYGIVCQCSLEAFNTEEIPGGPSVPGITNEWAMVVVQARIENGVMSSRMAYFTWGGEVFPSEWNTDAVQAAHFAKDARVRISIARMGGVDMITALRDIYGMKLFPYCLSDDELRNVRDLDMFEMQRRGMTRWRAQ